MSSKTVTIYRSDRLLRIISDAMTQLGHGKPIRILPHRSRVLPERARLQFRDKREMTKKKRNKLE